MQPELCPGARDLPTQPPDATRRRRAEPRSAVRTRNRGSWFSTLACRLPGGNATARDAPGGETLPVVGRAAAETQFHVADERARGRRHAFAVFHIGFGEVVLPFRLERSVIASGPGS